ncbi:ABC transporter substrate-binding protein [Polymorphospora lycopeni]|uniref:ABC transporter substrate-binding protein n=1 Tax=Polymorphospora lycopeni TaxID=3140240 RepID=A0ABV5CS84_9ACTN
MGLSLVLAACSGNGNSGNDVDESILEHTSTEALAAMVRTDGAPGEPTGTLRIGSWISNGSFDPVAITVIQGQNLHPAYDPLFQINDKYEPLPWLVASWEEPTATSARLTLREDVVFHDGTPFNAEAVKVNLERAAATTTSPNANMYASIESVTVESEFVALVEFERPYPDFYYNMATPAGMMVSPAAIAQGRDLSREPAGSGGWRWKGDEFAEGSKQVYTANPGYWNPDAVKVSRVEINIYTDPAARLNAYTSGQIDMMTYVPDANKALVETSGSRVFSDLSIATTVVIMDREGTVVPAFGDPRVRQAIGLLIDRDGFNVAVLGRSGYPAGGFSSPTTPWYDEALNQRALDIEQAKQLLTEAGYPDGFSFQFPSTTSIAPAVVAVQQMLAAGGITMNIVDLPPSEYTAAQRKGEYPASYLIPTAVDIDQWWTRTVSNNGPLNPFKLTDLEDLEKRYVDSLALPTAERAPILKELQAEVINRGVIFPLSLRSRIAAAKEQVVATQQPVLAPEDWALRPHYLWLTQ